MKGVWDTMSASDRTDVCVKGVSSHDGVGADGCVNGVSSGVDGV